MVEKPWKKAMTLGFLWDFKSKPLFSLDQTVVYLLRNMEEESFIGLLW